MSSLSLARCISWSNYSRSRCFVLLYRSDTHDGDSDVTLLKRPVIIHRAILGSVERFMAILTEHFAGELLKIQRF